MGREGENLAPGAGEPPSAVDAYKASGAAVGGLHGGPDCRSGTKGQPPWCSLAPAGLRGRDAAPAKLAARKRVSAGVPRGTPQLRQALSAQDRCGHHGRRVLTLASDTRRHVENRGSTKPVKQGYWRAGAHHLGDGGAGSDLSCYAEAVDGPPAAVSASTCCTIRHP
jgi:hypothetical protein